MAGSIADTGVPGEEMTSETDGTGEDMGESRAAAWGPLELGVR